LALTPTLASVEALYRKLERELYRTHHQLDRIHKADHFFNFCVTAHSMRDYFFERQAHVAPSSRQPFYDQWAKEPLLVAVEEIANSTKHFVLRDRQARLPRSAKTKRVRLKRDRFIDLYVGPGGQAQAFQLFAPDAVITLSDNTTHDLYGFMASVLNYWRTFLQRHGIRVRGQAFKKLSGSVT
jgi:hypothetical protein